MEAPLLNKKSRSEGGEGDELGLSRRVWDESKKLWRIVGPAIFSRVVTYSMNVITQAFAGHLGDLELASISIANTVVVGFNFGLMVLNFLFLFSYFYSSYMYFSIHLFWVFL